MFTILNFLILNFIQQSQANTNDFALDYTKANKNIKVYDQVPKNELIFAKFQAIEPVHFSENPLRGRGFEEPLMNEIILQLRNNKINTYVDYFTVAKFGFYLRSKEYEICGIATRTLHQYKNLLKKNHKGAKLKYIGIPYSFLSAIGMVGLGLKKKNHFTKHLWPGTNVYNTKSLLDDPDLFTAQITGMGTSIKQYIYTNEKDITLKKQYKKNVYDFVASNSFQIPMMLKGKRMDWVDLSLFGDFYIKKLNIGPDVITLAPISNTHPDKHTIDDIKVAFPVCFGSDRSKMEKQIALMNEIIKKRRTNLEYWTALLKQFAIDMQLPYEDPTQFYYTKTLFKWKKEIDRGDFD